MKSPRSISAKQTLEEESRVLEKWKKSFGIGRKVGDQDDQPFNDSFEALEVINWWNQVKDYQIESPLVIFLPCAKATISGKKIQDSVTHRTFGKFITRWAAPYIQRIIISEPLTIIPYEITDYPRYNYPPALLRMSTAKRIKDYQLFVSRLQYWLKEQQQKHLWVWFGLSRDMHHPRILQASWVLKEPLFAIVPKGGTRNIGYGAHSLRYMLETIIEGETTDSSSDKRLKPDLLRIYKIMEEDRRINPQLEDFMKLEINRKQFMRDFSKEYVQLQSMF